MQWRTLNAAGVRCISAFAFLAALVVYVPGFAQAQTLGGSAYGASVKTPLTTTNSPVATLPSTGGYNAADAQTFGVPSAIDASWLSAVTTGSSRNGSERGSSTQSVSEVENVNVLSGVIQAQNITAVANSVKTASGAASGSDGSGFVGLVVNGASLADEVAPNTRIDLLGIGYVVLNEVTRTGDGVSSTGITVNMIHLYKLGGGEIIVGSASSSVSP